MEGTAAELNELAALQATTGQEIQRLITNFKKDGSDRKQNKKYYEDRLHKLEEARARFQSQDSKIRALEDNPTTHPYFVKEYFNEVMAMVQQYQVIFRNAIRSLTTTNDNDVTENIEPTTATTSQVATDIIQPRTHIGLVRRLAATSAALNRLLSTLSNSQEDASYYNVKIDSIKQLWNQIESTNLEIWEKHEDPTLIGHNVQEYIEIEELVQKRLIELSNKAEQCKINNALVSTTIGVGKTLQLPKVTIPKFDGNYLKWRQFYDLFCQLIHNQKLPNVQKMWYLKTNLTGEAEHLIRHLTLTQENYETAWNLLQDRYNNMRLLTGTLIQAIINQPSGTSTVAAIKGLHDTTQESLLALNNLGIETATWDPILLHILIAKLDKSTKILYERSITQPREVQKLEDFLTFLETQFQTMESIGETNKSKAALRTCTSAVVSGNSCKLCKTGVHPLFACKRFLQQTISDRSTFVRKQNLCINCLRVGHIANQCASRGCTKCNKKHNTLLHFESKKPESPSSIPNQERTPEATTLAASRDQGLRPYVLLSTAIIRIIAENGREVNCRVILDSGSQVNLVTERLVKRLGISPKAASLNIQGIGESNKKSQQRINVKITSRINGFSTRLEAFVLNQIISNQPSQQFETSKWPIPKNIALADPDFNTPARIDALLGAEFYHQLLSIGQIQLGEGLPVLQNTVFGWILSGKIWHEHFESATCGICTEDESLNVLVERMWQLDEISTTNRTLSPAEQLCETHFAQHTIKNEEGRFMVKLPFIDNTTCLGESRGIAMNRFLALERRLTKDENLQREYVKFMNEYIQLGHMTEIDINDALSPNYFIPHHCVIKPESSTTKLRVVFDASAKTTSGKSLNDIMHIGPTTQSELFAILLRFRLPRFVFTTDIQKMYRQILIHPEDRRYQLIIWRNHPKSAVKYYQLNTVTYGTRSAPYLATRCLQQIAKDNKVNYPLGAQVLEDNFYVDDGLGGSDSLSEAIEAQRQLSHMLKTAGFNLRKWCANHPQLLQNIPHDDQEVNLDFSSESNESIKTLGLTWLPKTDKFCVKVNLRTSNRITKRTITSDLAKLFDPLGIMAPVVVTAKLFIQELWQLKVSWDEALPAELHTRWDAFRKNLAEVKNLQISRHIFKGCVPESIQIHAFGDASERAFGAAVYIRSVCKDGRVIVRLLCAKSRVAPLKRQTLPRLELCAAVLCAQLATRVKTDLRLQNNPIFLWTDSEIVLSWINSTSSSFQTFVANRVALIQEVTLAEQWRHVSSKDNPADVLSRGLTPKALANCNIWFYGPLFLHGSEDLWPKPFKKESLIETELEKKHQPLSLTCVSNSAENIIYNINHRNSFRTLQHIVAYVLRFSTQAKCQLEARLTQTVLTPFELDKALKVIIRTIQASDFKDDIKTLARSNEVNKISSLNGLSPFIDNDGIIRVGGRLSEATLPYDAKHQMLLPYNDPLTKLLLKMLHETNFHCGPQALLAIARQRFWPIKGKLMARSIVQHCIRCNKAKPQLLNQMMGNLPASRVVPARPFITSGVDYCGPFWVHFKIRGKKPQKAYIAVFCCFKTKAVHLELVSELTTDAFIAALKRFVSRRGHCQDLYCDNATNFVGAKNELTELNTAIFKENAQEKIATECSNKGIKFHFIPPRAPHFGGLWEAAVKSAKHLLVRSVSTASLTYEELETVVVGIEAILNSRPITPMSNSPDDLEYLTPGHFLIGEPLTAPVDPNAAPDHYRLLTRWKLVSHIKQEMWNRWVREYLNELQQRTKWTRQHPNIQKGDMVIIKEDNIPVMKWPLGRVVQIIKGNDGLVRVAEIKTKSGVFKRPIHRLALLPVESTTESEKSTIESDCSRSHTEHNEDHSSSENLQEDIPAKRKKLPGPMTTLLMCLLLLPTIFASSVEIKPFGSNIGIHFEGIGSTRITTSTWKLIIHYDLGPLLSERTMFYGGIGQLQNICDHLQNRNQCHNILTRLKHLINTLPCEKMFTTEKRTKRGAVNAIGNVAHYLFGILDSDYAEDMTNTINLIKQNENHVLTLIKNQTSIVDSTLNIIKQDQQAVDEKFDKINDSMNTILRSVHDQNEANVQLKLFQTFSSLAMQLLLTGNNIYQTQSSIFDLVTDTHHGKINPLLLSPQQLKAEVAKIKTHLPTTLHFPVEQEDILQLYRLMTTTGGGIAKDQLVFTVTLPLVDQSYYELFRIIPIPTVKNDTMVAIVPCSDILAINPHRDQYFQLSEEQLLTCITAQEDKYICPNEQPRHNVGSYECACEVNLLNNDFSPICNIEKLNRNTTWIKINGKNQWIYGMKNPIKAVALCGQKSSQLMLTGSGLLQLQPECTLRHQFISITAHKEFSSTARTSYTILSNISEIIDLTQPTPVLEHLDLGHYKPLIKNLTDLHKEITAQDIRMLPTKINVSNLHHFSVGYTALILSIGVSLLLAWKYINCKKRPIPLPRNLENPVTSDFIVHVT